MSSMELINAVAERFGTVVRVVGEADRARIELDAPDWPAVAQWLRQEPSVELDWLRCLTGIDYAADGRLAVAYHFWSFRHRHDLAVKVFTPRDQPSVASVARLWPAADWHEREAYDLLGITFDGHPDLRRILLADDWVGHPLRKDYQFPREYHGIPGSVELDWAQQ